MGRLFERGTYSSGRLFNLLKNDAPSLCIVFISDHKKQISSRKFERKETLETGLLSENYKKNTLLCYLQELMINLFRIQISAPLSSRTED